MSTNQTHATDAAIANANLHTWAAVVTLLEGGLLSGPTGHYDRAKRTVIKIATAQTQKELARFDKALARLDTSPNAK